MMKMGDQSKLAGSIQDFFSEMGGTVQHSLFELIKCFRQFSPQWQGYSDEQLLEAFKMAWNYEEETKEIFTLRDAIVWMKSNFDRALYSGGCIFKVEADSHHKIEPGQGREKGEENPAPNMGYVADEISGNKTPAANILHLCFLDKVGNPLLDGGARHKVVYCNMLDDALAKQFGDKNMIVLK